MSSVAGTTSGVVSRLPARGRVGWLLRVNRMLGAVAGDRTLQGFCESLVQRGQPITVSTLSRWETGKSAIPYWAPMRYERVLDLPRGLLTATADTAYRYHTPTSSARPRWASQREAVPGKPLDDLVDRAVGGDEMSGPDWDRLTELIASAPQLIFCPSSTWSRLAERLLTEMSIADGVHWMVRAEAYHRLITHPVGQRPVIATAAAAADDRSAQSMVGLLAVFTESSHPAANSSVVRHVLDPATNRTFYGALLSSAKKLRYGHFSHHQLRLLAPALLAIGDSEPEHARLAARLLGSLPMDVRARLPRRPPPPELATSTDDLVQRTCAAAQTSCVAAVDHAAKGVSDPVSRAAELVVDPLLPVIVGEMLTDPVFDVRLCAMFLLYASPYRRPLARALATELIDMRRRRCDLELMIRVLESLRVLGAQSERNLIEQLILAPDVPTRVQETAAYALGHIGGSSTPAFFAAALTRYTDRWAATGHTRDASVLDRLTYALGITRETDLLHTVTQRPDMPSRVRSAARWWQSLPTWLCASAAR